MSTIAAEARLASSRTATRARRAVRLRRYLSHAGVLVLSVMIVVWTLAPIYNMVLISLEPEATCSPTTSGRGSRRWRASGAS